MTIWKTMRDFSRYEVSETGEVRNIISRRILKPGQDKDGYQRYSLKNDNGKTRSVRAHHAVADAFIAPRPSGQIVAHNDGNILNNHYGNLRFATHAENMADKIIHGTSRKTFPRTGAVKSPRAILTEDDVRQIKMLFKSGGISNATVATRFGVGRSTIAMIRSGKNWSHIS